MSRFNDAMSKFYDVIKLLRPENRATKTVLFLMIPMSGAIGAVIVHSKSLWPSGILWALAMLALGATLGFLFGIPKVLQANPAPPAVPAAATPASGAPTTKSSTTGTTATSTASANVAVNTNLEQISDWLTKIIVGLGLMNIAKFPEHIVRAARYVGLSFGPDPIHERFACALLVCFTLIGFAMGYLLTRLYLQTAFAEADLAATTASEFGAALEQEMRKSSNRDDGLPTDSQVAAADRIGQLAISVEEKVIREQVENLAREYERTRASLRAGAERTTRLDDCVARMRPLAMAARIFLGELQQSTSPGLRLFAISTLTVAPDAEHLAWILARFEPDAERPFVVYQAALALVAAATKLTAEESGQAVREAIERAKKLSADPARDRVLAQALETVKGKSATVTATPPSAGL